MRTALKSRTLASDYVALASQCRTPNKLDALHIGFENLLAPAEFTYLADLARRQELPGASYPWLGKIADFSSGVFECPQRFGRSALSEHVLLYRDPETDPGQKSLLVAFCGNGRRLGMPTPVFLQCLDSSAWDVVLLRKGDKRRSYLAGLEGLSNSFSRVVRYVETATSADRYRRVISFGVSGGGYAAILAAMLMKAPRGIAIGGCAPASPLRFGLRWRLSICRATVTSGPEFDFVYAADNGRDQEAALSLRNSFGGTLRPVPEADEHNVLGTLLKRGQLPDFLAELLA